jgi:hypothetical protein
MLKMEGLQAPLGGYPLALVFKLSKIVYFIDTLFNYFAKMPKGILGKGFTKKLKIPICSY